MRIFYAHIKPHSLAEAVEMQAREKVKPHRKPTNLSLDSELLREAKALGINVSRSAEAGIEAAVRNQKQMDWLKDNATALASSNNYVEEHGLPLSQYRQF
jgi:antitoxin CcdA